MLRRGLLLLVVLAVSACHTFRDESSVPLRGRLVLEVAPNPLVAKPLGEEWYEMEFDIVMREEGGVGVTIEEFTVEAVAFRTVTISKQTFPGSYIVDRGYPSSVDAGKYLRFSFSKRWQLPTRLLVSGASARVTARTIDQNGVRGQSALRVDVVVGDSIAPQPSVIPSAAEREGSPSDGARTACPRGILRCPFDCAQGKLRSSE